MLFVKMTGQKCKTLQNSKKNLREQNKVLKL